MACECKGGKSETETPETPEGIGVTIINVGFPEDSVEPMDEVRMAMSSLGEDSAHLAVNIPKDIEAQIMRLCARDDITRSTVVRACIVLGLPILESLHDLASVIDPGGKRSPSNTHTAGSR